jgi:hypothetical protein
VLLIVVLAVGPARMRSWLDANSSLIAAAREDAAADAVVQLTQADPLLNEVAKNSLRQQFLGMFDGKRVQVSWISATEADVIFLEPDGHTLFAKQRMRSYGDGWHAERGRA